MNSDVARVIAHLDKLSLSQQHELDELNAKGASFVRAAAGRLLLDVGPAVGRFLNQLVRLADAKIVVEIGASSGYSSLWLAEALRSTGGRLFSIEPDQQKQSEQQANLVEAGLVDYVQQVPGQASSVIGSLPAPFDLVLIDHWKDLYISDFDLVWPRMRRGGLVVADNIVKPEATRGLMRAYIEHVTTLAGGNSITVNIGNGVELTCRA